MQTRLTTKSVMALKPRAKRYWVNDKELPGFRVSVSPTGTKSFAVRLRSRGGRKNRADSMQSIGRLGPLTVEEARTRARELLSRTTLGEDVAQGLREGRTAETVQELSALFLEARAAVVRPTTLDEYQRLFDVEITPALGTRAARDLTTRDVARLHHRRKDTPYLANRIVTLLSALSEWARRNGYVPKDFDVTSGVDRFPEASRERYLTEAETLRLGASLRLAETVGVPRDPKRTAYLSERAAARAKQPYKRKFKKPRVAKPAKEPEIVPSNPYAIAAIRFLLLSGWRRREVLTLRWDAVDLQGKRARLPDTKSGLSWRELGGAATQLLRDLPRLDGSPLVFPGEKAGEPLSSIQHVWYAVRAHAKLPDVRLHDLRHNFASVGAQGGTSLLVLGAVLGHRELSTTQKYAHLGERPTARAAEEISSRISSMLAGKSPGDAASKVVDLDAHKHRRAAGGRRGKK